MDDLALEYKKKLAFDLITRLEPCLLHDETLNFDLNKKVYPELTQYDLPPKIYASVASLLYSVGQLGNNIKNVLKLQKWDRLPDCFRAYVIECGRFSGPLHKRREVEIKNFL